MDPISCVSHPVKTVTLDSELSFQPHIRSITKSGFYHLKNIARVRSFLSQASAETLIHAFITNHVDYCNALLSGLPKKTTAPLQLLQNSARAHHPSTEVSAMAPVSFRIDFKVLLLVYKAPNGLSPIYLSDLLLSYEPLGLSGPQVVVF
ncbi:hypothetical protein NL108_007318 [Boleophthalmus pectinirostris]|nr:hypothetical protein NL108_007318 [Boleophthalmus pectinirostris]